MAKVNVLAKFLSQALEWKARFPTAQFYGGLRYEPFVYEKARLAFPEYSKLYPDNKQFTEKFVKDLRNRDRELLKIIDPEVVTAAHEAQDRGFETEAQLEQQQVAQTNPQEVTQPFSLATATTIARRPPISTVISAQPEGEKGEETQTMESTAPPPQAPPQQSAKTGGKPGFTLPKMPTVIPSAGKSLATNAGIFFQRNVGKYLTFGNALTGAFTAIGGFAGGVFAGGNPLGVLAGAGAGAVGSVWARSREGLQSMANFANGGINSMVRFSNQVSSGGLSLAGPKKRVWVWALGIFMFIFGFSLFTSISAPGQTTPTSQAAPVGPAGIIGITSCTFYRGGDRVQGLKIANPALSSLISEISNKVGVPPAIIAGIMRVETASAIVSTSDYLTNDYDAHSSGVAYGIMQFTPPTFEGVFSNNKEEMLSLFAKKEARSTIDPPDNMASNNILRIYSIRDSVIAAAFKVRADKKSINGDGPWDENTIKEVAKRYYGTNADGTTNYPGWDGSTQNYGDDLWKSYSNCQPLQVSVLASCPIQDPIISCGSFNSGHPYCEHANPDKGYPRRASYLDSTKFGMDVVGRDPLDSDKHLVYLPSIGNQKTEWEFLSEEPIPNYNVCQPPTQCSGHEWGFSRAFATTGGTDRWEIHLKHVNTGDPTLTKGQKYSSGTFVGRLYPDLDGAGKGHNHINILKNGSYIRPDVDLKMCNPTYL